MNNFNKKNLYDFTELRFWKLNIEELNHNEDYDDDSKNDYDDDGIFITLGISRISIDTENIQEILNKHKKDFQKIIEAKDFRRNCRYKSYGISYDLLDSPELIDINDIDIVKNFIKDLNETNDIFIIHPSAREDADILDLQYAEDFEKFVNDIRQNAVFDHPNQLDLFPTYISELYKLVYNKEE